MVRLAGQTGDARPGTLFHAQEAGVVADRGTCRSDAVVVVDVPVSGICPLGTAGAVFSRPGEQIGRANRRHDPLHALLTAIVRGGPGAAVCVLSAAGLAAVARHCQ